VHSSTGTSLVDRVWVAPHSVANLYTEIVQLSIRICLHAVRCSMYRNTDRIWMNHILTLSVICYVLHWEAIARLSVLINFKKKFRFDRLWVVTFALGSTSTDVPEPFFKPGYFYYCSIVQFLCTALYYCTQGTTWTACAGTVVESDRYCRRRLRALSTYEEKTTRAVFNTLCGNARDKSSRVSL